MAKLPKIKITSPELADYKIKILTFDLILLKDGIFLAKNFLYPIEIKDNINYLANHIMTLSQTPISVTPIAYNIKNTLIDGMLRVSRNGSLVTDTSKGICYDCLNSDVAEQLYNCLIYIHSKLWEHKK